MEDNPRESTLIDAGPLIALFERDDGYHRLAPLM